MSSLIEIIHSINNTEYRQNLFNPLAKPINSTRIDSVPNPSPNDMVISSRRDFVLNLKRSNTFLPSPKIAVKINPRRIIWESIYGNLTCIFGLLYQDKLIHRMCRMCISQDRQPLQRKTLLNFAFLIYLTLFGDMPIYKARILCISLCL